MNISQIEKTLAQTNASEIRLPVETSLSLVKANFSNELLETLTDRIDIIDFVLDNTSKKVEVEPLDEALENLFWFENNFCES